MDYNNNYGKVADEFDGLAEVTDDKQIFRRFKRKSIASRDWILDLITNGYRSAEKRSRRSTVEEGLFMSDEMQEVGVLSIAPSLSALLFELSLLKDADTVEIGGTTFEAMLTENKSAVLNIITSSICKLLAECYPNGFKGNSDNVLLSSMPFYDDTTATDGNGWDAGGYLDTASWVFLVSDSIEAFLYRLEKSAPDVYKKLKWEIKGDKNISGSEMLTTEEVKAAVRAIYLGCIKVTCDCIVQRDGKVAGWTFRKMGGEAEPSLYFSYVASTVYLGLYKRFNGKDNTISKLRHFEKKIHESENTRGFRFYKDITNPSQREKTIKWLDSSNFTSLAAYLRNLSAEQIDELDLLYNKINNGQPLTYKFDEYDTDGAFTLLKNASIQLADTLWNEGFGTSKNKLGFKVNMAKGPCFEDGSLIDMSAVRLSSHNNAFFNNLFVIGIILNSAYDVELQKKSAEEYDNMFNTFQLSIQNTQRCYNEIESEGLLYKIDSYILDFSDKVDSANQELAKQLRKVNMAVVPLMPLMLKNNNLMSQYVVRYPQKQMTESLKDIIRNKKRKNGVSSWVWDKDGYNAITNYYYVDALISFYRYYEEFEEPFVASEEDKRRSELKAVKAEQDKFAAVLRSKVNELNSEIKQRDDYIAEVRAISKGIARLVVNGLIDLIDEQITPEKLLGELSKDEKLNMGTVIEELNSFDKDNDVVKISKLVHLSEKLQILSLLSMDYDPQVMSLIKKGDPHGQALHHRIIESVFGEKGSSSKYLLNLLSYISTSAGLINNIDLNNINNNDKNNQ